MANEDLNESFFDDLESEMDEFEKELEGSVETEESSKSEEQSLSTEQVSERVDKFKKYAGDKPYLILGREAVKHFMSLLSYQMKLGFDIYATSFKIDTTDIEEGYVWFVYSNRLVMARTKVDVEYQGEFQSCIASVATMLKVFARSQGKIFLFEEESDVYSYLFGGRVYVETYVVAKDICSKESLMPWLAGDPVRQAVVPKKTILNQFPVLDELSKLGARSEERAAYFRGGKVYIYAGQATGVFPGLGFDMTLQQQDLHTVMLFFEDAPEDVKLIEKEGFLTLYCEDGRELFLGVKKMELSDTMKHTRTSIDNGVEFDVEYFLQIITFLNEMQNTGMIHLKPKEYGFDLVCYQKEMEHNSVFPVQAEVKGEGIIEVRLSISQLKMFLKVFEGKVEMKTDVNKLFVASEKGGEVMLYGNV